MTTKVTRNMLNTSIVDNGNATALTIDTNENLGLASRLSVGTTTVGGGNTKVVVTGSADNYLQLVSSTGNGGISIGNHSGGNLLFYSHTGALGSESFTERMRLTSDGNLGIRWAAPTARLGILQNGSTTPGMNITDGASADFRVFAGYVSGTTRIGTSAGNLAIDTGGTERARVNTSGNLLLATTSAQESTTHLLTVGAYGRNGNGIYVGGYSGNDMITLSTQYDQTYGLKCMRGQSVKGYLYINSAGSDMVNSGSDERLKENIQTWEEDVSSKFKNIKPKTFNFIDDEDKKTVKGFIAQDMIDKFPEAYPYNEEEERYFYSAQRMVVYLMKGMQEQQEQIESLQQEIEALKNG